MVKRLACVLFVGAMAVSASAAPPPKIAPVLKPKALPIAATEFSAVDKTELAPAGKGVKVAKGEVAAKVDPRSPHANFAIERAVDHGTLLVKTPTGNVQLRFKGKDLEVTPGFAFSLKVSRGEKVEKKLDGQKAGTSSEAYPWIANAKSTSGGVKLDYNLVNGTITIRGGLAAGDRGDVGWAAGDRGDVGWASGDRGDVGWTWEITPAAGKVTNASFSFKSDAAFAVVALPALPTK